VSRSTGSSRLARLDVKLALLFVVSQLGVWTGCNAILGNGYGAFDESAGGGPGSEGGPESDALVSGEGGPGADGQGTGDGAGGGDGSSVDGSSVDGGLCPGPKCPTKLTDAPGAQRIALGTLYVYWTTATDIGRVSLDGSGPTSKAVVGGPIVSTLKRGIAVQGGIPYVTVGDRGAAKCTAALSDSCTNMPFIGTGVVPVSSSIAVDASFVYIGLFKDTTVTHGGLWQTDLNGASPMPYTMPLDHMLAVRVVASTLYYMTTTALRFVPSTSLSGTPADAATLASPPVAFDVQGSKLVVATSANEIRVCQSSPSAGCVTTPAQIRMNAISAVILDGATMIWAEGDSIFRASLLTGAAVETLATGQSSPVDLAVDSNFIYWANQGDSVGTGGAIMKVPK
jgi:hypothetical protein